MHTRIKKIGVSIKLTPINKQQTAIFYFATL